MALSLKRFTHPASLIDQRGLAKVTGGAFAFWARGDFKSKCSSPLSWPDPQPLPEPHITPGTEDPKGDTIE